jgi:hypothetical protein
VTSLEPSARTRPGRRSPWGRRLLLVVVLAAVFVLGAAVGKALNDDPPAGVDVTFVRTLEPLPQEPAATGP